MPTDESPDPYAWLEDVLGEPALAWVRERNAASQALLQARPEYEPIRTGLIGILNAVERIPQVSRRGDWFYNYWQDEAHPRGVWRRTTFEDYRQPDPSWETVLDLDALGAAEGENWVWGGAVGLPTDPTRVLLSLSRGGADAAVVREFDTTTKAFVPGGFEVPEAKSEVVWIDADTIYIGSDFGPGSLTTSGYPRTVRRWARGTPLAQAPTVFVVDAQDMTAYASVDATPGHERTLYVRVMDFYRREYVLQEDGQRRRLDVPEDATISFWNSAGDPEDTLLVELRSDWTVRGRSYPSGSLLAIDASEFLAGGRTFQVVFEPTPRRSLGGYTTSRRHLLINVLEDVAGRLVECRRTPQGLQSRVVEAPFPGTLSAGALHDPMRPDDPLEEAYLLSYSDFLTPETLWLARTGTDAREVLKSQPARFDAAGMHVEQQFATSTDGTQVPYFVIRPPGATTDPRPTLLYGYGGFEISMQPGYRAGIGMGWLERGGVFVIANIRGGGEYGPAWHQAAVKAGKQRSYDDFHAVAQDLVARGVTTSRQLGIEGGSNGGLLVGAAFTQRPDLYAAVVCSVPLLDMRRYHLLLAGASWMAEYGNPDDPAEWAYISAYSPYQNLRDGVRYPEVLFTTSTRDDRVHPAHARKMAARMLDAGQAVLYYENIEGGHGGAADNAQRAHVQALEMTFLWRCLGGPVPAILGYWFGHPGQFWFTKSEATDREIATRFGDHVERALRGEYADWAGTPKGGLALLLLLDQFTRNVFRNTPRAFEGDAQALAIAQAMVDSGADLALSPTERGFVYLPFEHAEDLGMQDESVRLFERLGDADMLDYARRHREVIRRFGRFPHRNAVIGRESTPGEVAFLREPGSGF